MNDNPDKLTHLDAAGAAHMVDVGAKVVSQREAVAEGFVTMRASTARAIATGAVPKGDVFACARIAGIMAAKKCGELIPLCHPLPIESCAVSVAPSALDTTMPDDTTVKLRIEATVRITAKTGVEMEALAAVSVAALTIYDMCKAIDKGMTIEGMRVVRKTKTTA
jgi:cyclic pyranopterin monophosphate synthase